MRWGGWGGGGGVLWWGLIAAVRSSKNIKFERGRAGATAMARATVLLLVSVVAATPSAAQITSAAPDQYTCGDEETEGEAEYWRTYNDAFYARSVFGGLSIVACLTVLCVSYAHGKDRRSLRDRIITGLFVSNLVFSIANAPPLGAYMCRDGEEGRIVTTEAWKTTDHIVLFGMLYSGKWWMISYELFIVIISVATMRSGSINIPRNHEIAGHAVCFAVGLIVFLVFVLKAGPRLQAGVHGDLAAWVEYEAVETHLMDGWVTLFVIFMVLWIGLQLQLRKLTKEWNAGLVEAKEGWQNDDRWIEPDTAVNEARDRKQQLMDLQKQSYQAVVLPLAPYVWTFSAFSIPAIVLATDYCAAQTTRVNARKSGPEMPCFNGCYMVLAMRPLATAAVYFRDPQRRAELLDYRTLGRKLWRRLSEFFAWAFGLEDQRHGFRFNRELEEVRIIDDDAGDPGAEDGAAGSGVPYELMDSET